MLFGVGKWDNKLDIYVPYILSDYELESNFRGSFDVSLVKFPFVVHSNFVIVTEEVWNAL